MNFWLAIFIGGFDCLKSFLEVCFESCRRPGNISCGGCKLLRTFQRRLYKMPITSVVVLLRIIKGMQVNF